MLSGIGLDGRPTFSDHRHLVIYGQRTADGRLAFGGRGAPYHFRSRIQPSYDEEPRVFAGLRATLQDMFDGLRDVEFTHAWGGPLGVPRDWCASVGLDRATGLAWAGGYVGDGVSTTNLAGRTLTDLILHRDTRPHPPPLGRPPAPPLGARTPALVRNQRRSPSDDSCRYRGARSGPGLNCQVALATARGWRRAARGGPVRGIVGDGHVVGVGVAVVSSVWVRS